MLLTITLKGPHAPDLGFLLHKHPDRVQEFSLAFGNAHVFYPVNEAALATAALLLEVDPIGLVRRRAAGGLEHYVNDRPYAASSLLSVAIAQVYGSALAGRCKDRPDVVDQTLPLEAGLAALPCRGGAHLLRRLFEPLDYRVSAERQGLDERFPEWGESAYHAVTLTRDGRLSDLLAHLYVLIPVLDDDKHYYVGEEEVEKLLRVGGDWLARHPERELIARRYLKHQRRLTREALSRLAEEDDRDPDARESAHDDEEAAVETPLGLNEQRLEAVTIALKESGAHRVLDLGCGEGKLLRKLVNVKQFTTVLGMDVSCRALEIAARRLHLDRMTERQQARLELIQVSLMYRDRRLENFDGAAVVEVIEHLDPPRLSAFERVVFEHARPGVVVVTTPNVEFNTRFPALPAGRLRHKDHRFEFTRDEFEAWGRGIGERFGYAVRFTPIGSGDPEVGSPTQMGVFTRGASDS